ncbi:uncharacterized protein VNE69_07040 [Vairimorpha necatrix]|uniref:Uncharacterized protein n=1 Tax=Vairimorpha necatrix TaxID=6039 RepID=A0AAX4JDC6_9MICR
MNLLTLFFLTFIIGSKPGEENRKSKKNVCNLQNTNKPTKQLDDINENVDFKSQKMLVNHVTSKHLSAISSYFITHKLHKEEYIGLLNDIAEKIMHDKIYNAQSFLNISEKNMRKKELTELIEKFAILHDKKFYLNKEEIINPYKSEVKYTFITETFTCNYKLYEWFMDTLDIDEIFLVTYNKNEIQVELL